MNLPIGALVIHTRNDLMGVVVSRKPSSTGALIYEVVYDDTADTAQCAGHELRWYGNVMPLPAGAQP